MSLDWTPARLKDLLVAFVEDADRSLAWAQAVEAELDNDPLAMTFEDYGTAVASYRPHGGPGTLDEEAMLSIVKDWLHDLDDHRFCLHDVPLSERP